MRERRDKHGTMGNTKGDIVRYIEQKIKRLHEETSGGNALSCQWNFEKSEALRPEGDKDEGRLQSRQEELPHQKERKKNSHRGH